MQVTTDLDTKRADAMVRIARAALGTGASRVLPTPVADLAQELGIAAADAWMFYEVYTVYFDAPLDAASLNAQLQESGLATGGLAVAYVTLRLMSRGFAVGLSRIPLFGRLIAGLITGGTTFGLGVLWQMWLEEAYLREMAVRPPVVTPEPEPAMAGAPGTAAAQPKSQPKSAPAPAELHVIATLRPDGKPGAVIDKRRYDAVRATIIDTLRGQESVTFQAVVDAVEAGVKDLDKAARWYVNVIKLDLEAHGVIERVPGKSPQELRLVEAS